MMSKKQLTIILIIVLAFIIGVGAFAYFKGVNNKTSNSLPAEETKSQTADSSKDRKTEKPEQIEYGYVEGSLSYPSEGVPPQVFAGAINLDTNEEFTTDQHLKSSKYRYGVGYRLKLPVGRYHLYAAMPSEEEGKPARKAFYTEYAKCGMEAECKFNADKVVVEIKKDQTTDGILLGDWYVESYTQNNN